MIAVAVIVLLVLKLRSDGDASDATGSGESHADRIAALEAAVEQLREQIDSKGTAKDGEDVVNRGNNPETDDDTADE